MSDSLGKGNGALSRRAVIKVATVGTAAAALSTFHIGNPALAAGRITVRDGGGSTGDTYKKAFYDPFTKETGVVVNQVTSQYEPVAQIKLMVETKNIAWDMLWGPASVAVASSQYIEELGSKVNDDPNVKNIPDNFRTSKHMGTSAYATHMAYRTDKFQAGPANWADFFDLKKFPGRRAMRKAPFDTLEQALLADGVTPDKLYPLDLDRAFKKLDQIKKDVAVWFSGGAQASQILKTGEIDLIATWNSRTAAAINDGAPAKVVWNQALVTFEGPMILKGTPNGDACRELIRFCARPDRQAFLEELTLGPTNPNAFKTIKPERAALLPTSPEVLPVLVTMNDEYWLKARDQAVERFNAWIIS